MFLANSLKEKLKKNYLEENDTIGKPKYEYSPAKNDPRHIVSFKPSNTTGTDSASTILPPSVEFSTQKLKSMDKKEWETRFTLRNLRREWKTKVELDFDKKFKKFTDDTMSKKVQDSRTFIHNLVDMDTLELKRKRWDISSDPSVKKRPELKQTLFEVNNGLKDFKIVPLKVPYVEEGVDTRNNLEEYGGIWNTNTKISNLEKKELNSSIKDKASENSIRYWKDNEYSRMYEEAFPITEERKKFEVIRHFKAYKTPYEKTKNYYNTMNKVKDLTEEQRSSLEKKIRYQNPSSDDERINALVFREMYNVYKKKYNELTGNVDKKTLKMIQNERNKFHWKDDDLVNKIQAVSNVNQEMFYNSVNNFNKYKSGNLLNSKTVNNSFNNSSNNIKTDRVFNRHCSSINFSRNFNVMDYQNIPNFTANELNSGFNLNNNSSTYDLDFYGTTKNLDPADKRNLLCEFSRQLLSKTKTKSQMNLLSSLTNKNSSISPEAMTRDLLKHLVNKGDEVFKEQEKIKDKIEEETRIRNKKEVLQNKKNFRIVDTDPLKVMGSKYPLNKQELENLKKENKKNDNENEGNFLKLNQPLINSFGVDISKSINDSHFLEAYQKVSEKENDVLNKIKRKNIRDNVTYEYRHPGTFREFNTRSNSSEYIHEGKDVEKMWSCCMNTNPDSKGCQKIMVKVPQYLLGD